MPIVLTLLIAVPLAAPAEPPAPTPSDAPAPTAAPTEGIDAPAAASDDEVLADPWTEDIEIELAEVAAACGIGVCTTLINLPLTLLTFGLWSGIVLPTAIGVLITYLNNGSTRWHSAIVWPVIGALIIGGTWTLVTLLGWAFFGSWFLAASDPNFGLNIFPPNSSNYAQAVLPAVNVSLIVMSALGPAVSTLGAIGAYNVTAELLPEGAETTLLPQEGPLAPNDDVETEQDAHAEQPLRRRRASTAKTAQSFPQRF